MELWETRPGHVRKASSGPLASPLGSQSCQRLDQCHVPVERASGAESPVRVVLLIDPRSPCHCQGMLQPAQQCSDRCPSPHQMAFPPASAASRLGQKVLTVQGPGPSMQPAALIPWQRAGWEHRRRPCVLMFRPGQSPPPPPTMAGWVGESQGCSGLKKACPGAGLSGLGA